MASSSERPSGPRKTSSTSCPSSNTESENPFIAFRRYADSQISSLLQSVIGLPSLFSQPDSNGRWSNTDARFAKHMEARIRANQELIDMLDREMLETISNVDASSLRREQEMQKWGAFFNAAKVDRPQEKVEQEKKTSSMIHEQLGWDGKQRTGVTTLRRDETKKDHDERFAVSTSGGNVNLKRVVDCHDEGQGFWMDKDDPRLDFNTATSQDPFAEPNQAVSWLLTDDYSPLYLDRSLPYKLHQSFYKTDAADSYFRAEYQPGDLYPRFASESTMRHDPRLAEQVNWRAAFHDLLEVRHKGTLVPSSLVMKTCTYLTTANPGRWISYLADHGSLGSNWRRLSHSDSCLEPHRLRYGNSTETWAVSSFLGERFIRNHTGRSPIPQFGKYERKNDSLELIAESPEFTLAGLVSTDHSTGGPVESAERFRQTTCSQSSEAGKQLTISQGALDNEYSSYRPAFAEAAISLIRNPNTEQATLRTIDRVLRLIENPELEDEIDGILNKTFMGTDLTSPKMFKGWLGVVDHLFRNDHFQIWKATKEAVESEHHDIYGISVKDAGDETSAWSSTTSFDSQSSPFSSSSSYSSNHDPTTNETSDSIISTLTTVQSRTLPNGRVETRRVLKKRFADGREENSESTETLSGTKDCNEGAEEMSLQNPSARVSPAPKPSVDLAQNKKKAGGWFWTG